MGIRMLRAFGPIILAGVAALALAPRPAAAYTVQSGDTLWRISQQTGVSVDTLARDNHLSDPARIYAGQELSVISPRPVPTQVDAHTLLVDAAYHHGLRRSFVLAVAYWESGWNQNVVSRDGAIGLMQILPATGDWAGPALLGRRVDLRDARDNAELGAALLRQYLEDFNGDHKLALAAYYQGAAAVRKHGVYPSSRSYIDGIWALRNRFEASAQ